MKIKRKIIINAIVISWFSIIVAGSLMLWRSEKLGAKFLFDTERERLTSVRYFKSQQVVKYFKDLADYIVILANNQTTVSALQGFSKTFPKYLHPEVVSGYLIYCGDTIRFIRDAAACQ